MNDDQARTAISVLEHMEREAFKAYLIFEEMYVEIKNAHGEVPKRIYKGMAHTKDVRSSCAMLRNHLTGGYVMPSYAEWFEKASKETA